jgi:hypothetical protein
MNYELETSFRSGMEIQVVGLENWRRINLAIGSGESTPFDMSDVLGTNTFRSIVSNPKKPKYLIHTSLYNTLRVREALTVELFHHLVAQLLFWRITLLEHTNWMKRSVRDDFDVDIDGTHPQK